MVPLSAHLISEAKRFFEIDALEGNTSAAICARRAVALVLHQYGWSRARIADRFGMTKDGIRTLLEVARDRLRTGGDKELRDAVLYLTKVLNEWSPTA